MEPPIQDYVYHAHCFNVVDGDTIDCTVDLGFRVFHQMRLRLLRIDTPELNSKDGEERIKAQEAKKVVIDRIIHQDIIIQTKKSDSFGRWLAEIWYFDDSLEIHSLNQELLDLGLAVEYKK